MNRPSMSPHLRSGDFHNFGCSAFGAFGVFTHGYLSLGARNLIAESAPSHNQIGHGKWRHSPLSLAFIYMLGLRTVLPTPRQPHFTDSVNIREDSTPDSDRLVTLDYHVAGEDGVELERFDLRCLPGGPCFRSRLPTSVSPSN